MNVSQAGAAGGWSLVKSSGGIKVYERSVMGTDLMEYMAVTAIDEKMEVIGEVLRDVPAYPNWIADCTVARVEKRYDRNTMAIYLGLKPPIIQERDVALKDKTVYEWDRGRAAISFAATDEINVPLKRGCVRVTVMNGLFDMEFLGRNRTKFIYKLLVDPAGNIPKKVAYAVMKSYPYDTLKRLRTVAPDRKYSNAARGTEEERAIDTRTKSDAYIRRILATRLAKFVKDKGILLGIINNDKNNIRNVLSAGASYESIEKASLQFYFTYLDKTVPDKGAVEKLKKNSRLVEEIIDMIVTDCGAAGISVESLIAKHQ
ncbi:MAG: hypothetical protein KA369_01220 [Spirochaetes bacterium]|nr:hypothetical protein [Spirochaetota bacterium]